MLYGKENPQSWSKTLLILQQMWMTLVNISNYYPRCEHYDNILIITIHRNPAALFALYTGCRVITAPVSSLSPPHQAMAAIWQMDVEARKSIRKRMRRRRRSYNPERWEVSFSVHRECEILDFRPGKADHSSHVKGWRLITFHILIFVQWRNILFVFELEILNWWFSSFFFLQF